MARLTELQERKIRHLFDVYDRRHNGYLERQDWELLAHSVAEARGLETESPEHEAITRAFLTQFERYKAVADFSRDGRIAPDEWVDFFEIVLGEDRAFEAVVGGTVAMIFRCFDLDEDAMIDREELHRLRATLGVHGEGDDDGLFDALDENGDGLLCATEVRHAVEDFFRSDDPDAVGNAFFGALDGG